jgi:hypothetical protein
MLPSMHSGVCLTGRFVAASSGWWMSLKGRQFQFASKDNGRSCHPNWMVRREGQQYGSTTPIAPSRSNRPPPPQGHRFEGGGTSGSGEASSKVSEDARATMTQKQKNATV